jgi:hypothetical protein
VPALGRRSALGCLIPSILGDVIRISASRSAAAFARCFVRLNVIVDLREFVTSFSFHNVATTEIVNTL